MKIIKRIHPGYKEFEKAKKENIKIPCMFGKYQYMYSSDKGKISLIFLKNYFEEGNNFWEILCFKDKLFKDVERFDTKEEAEIRIKKLLK